MEARGAAARGWRFRVVERGGRSVRSLLCRNPWAGPCSDPKCMVCSTNGRGNCGRTGCTYTIQCGDCRDDGPDTVPINEEEEGVRRPGQGVVGVPCTALYHRESGQSAYTRGLGHKKDIHKKNKKNTMVRHQDLYHNSEEVQFTMSVASVHRDPLSRQLRERVDIHHTLSPADKTSSSIESKNSVRAPSPAPGAREDSDL